MKKNGTKLTEEHKRKISISLLGHIVSSETKKKISEAQKGRMPWMMGRKHTEETRRKMSETRKGMSGNNKGKHWKLSKEARENIGKGHIGLRSGGWKLSEQTRRRMAIARSGEKCNFWKGGIGDVNKRKMDSLEYRLWRDAVFKRDKYTCQDCGAMSKSGESIYLEAHHKKSWAKYPELRFEINNGKTLCKKCHNKTKGYGRW